MKKGNHSVEQPVEYLRRSLERACLAGDRQEARKYITAGATTGDALHFAIRGGNLGIVEDLLHHGASPGKRDRLGKLTAIQTVALYGSLKTSKPMISLLIDHGAQMEEGPLPALHLAASHKRYHSVISLLSAGANPGAPSVTSGANPIHTVAAMGEITILIALIGSSPYAVMGADKWDATPLHYAARANQTLSVKFLIESGADIESVDIHGNTPLLDACRELAVDSATALIERGANVNARSVEGDTALLQASVMAGSPACLAMQTVGVLISAGADPLLLNDEGESPLNVVGSWVHEMEQEDLVEDPPDVRDMTSVKRLLKTYIAWLRRSCPVVIKKTCEKYHNSRERVALGRGIIGWQGVMAWLTLDCPTAVFQRIVMFL